MDIYNTSYRTYLPRRRRRWDRLLSVRVRGL